MEKVFPPTKIILSNSQLIRRNTKDAYAAFECIDSDRARLSEYLPWVKFNKSIDDQLWYIGECDKEWAAGTLFDYGITNQNGEYAGSIGIHNISWENQKCEIGYWLHRNFEGQGLISSALKALEKVLFELNFNRIEIRCDPRNKKSIGVPLRNNYVHEGILRQDTVIEGAISDTAVYSKIRTDIIKK